MTQSGLDRRTARWGGRDIRGTYGESHAHIARRATFLCGAARTDRIMQGTARDSKCKKKENVYSMTEASC